MGKRVNGKLVLVSVHAAAHGMETVRAFGVGDHQSHEMELAQHGRADGDPDMQDDPDRVLTNRIDRTLARELALGGRTQHARDTDADESPRDSKPRHAADTARGAPAEPKGDQPMPHDPGGELPANISLFDRVLINAGRLCYDSKIGQYVEKSAVLPSTQAQTLESGSTSAALPATASVGSAAGADADAASTPAETIFHGVDEDFNYVGFMLREKGTMTRKIGELKQVKQHAGADAANESSINVAPDVDERVRTPPKQRPCALCEKSFKLTNLPGVATFRALADWRAAPRTTRATGASTSRGCTPSSGSASSARNSSTRHIPTTCSTIATRPSSRTRC